MLLFIDKIFKGIAKAIEEMERQQAEQAAKQLATLKAARDRREAVRQSVEQGSVTPIQLSQQHVTKPPMPTHDVHSRIGEYNDTNVFDEYITDHHDPTDKHVKAVDLSAIQSKSMFESDRTHQIPLAPQALRILSQPNGPRDAFILNEIFNRPEHRWE